MNKKLHYKIFIAFIILCFATTHYNTYANNKILTIEQVLKQKRITVNIKNSSIKTILYEIQKQSGVSFLFKDEADSKSLVNLSLDVKNQTVEETLNALFLKTNFTYMIIGETVTIIKKPQIINSIQDVVTYNGKVLDNNDGKPVIGATLIIVGTTNGVISNDKGEFNLKAKGGDEIEVSYTGYKPQIVKLTNNQKNLIIKMELSTMAVEDVVVTGLFNRKKSGFSGTVTTIKKEELQKVSTGNIFTTISTLDAGFKINEDNLKGSDPNNIPDFTIRGKGSFQNNSTAPIFILDGFEVTSTKIFDMDVNRIESITLLKDASATILYGSRAANGVIVIETIVPKPGKLNVTYDFKPTIGVVDLSGYDLMNASEKLMYEKEADLYVYKATSGGTESFIRGQQKILDQQYYDRYRNVVEGVDTYWLSKPIQTSFSHAHSLYIDGGIDNVRYGIDASYNGNSGVMKNSGRDRVGLGFSLIYRVKDKVIIKNYISYSHTHAYNSPYGSFSQYSKLNPYEKIRYEDGEFIPKLSNGKANPLYNANLSFRDFTNTQEFNEQLSVDWNIIDGLRLKGQASIFKGNSDKESYQSPFSSQYLESTYNSATGLWDLMPIEKRGQLGIGGGNTMNMSGNVTLSYNKLFADKHLLYVGLGCEAAESSSNSNGYIVTGFPDDRYSDPAFAIQFLEKSKATSSESKARSMGVFSTLNYIFDDRYFVDLSARVDGSSRFGSDKKYAGFYSVGAGWNIHNEKFFGDNSVVDMLKLRTNYGTVGNQEFSAYQAKTMFMYNTDRVYNKSISAGLMGYGNPDLKWQNQNQFNVGLDFGFVKNRYRVQLNYYNKVTMGMLTEVSVAPSLGFLGNVFTANLGEIKNEGYEINVNAVIIQNRKKDIEWSMMVQAAHNKNTLKEISNSLKKLNEKNNEDKTTPAAVYEEGESMTAIKAVRSLGIDPVTGQEMFIRKSDGSMTYTWDPNDKILCGDTEPKLFGNIGTNLYYKGWNLNLIFRYRLGADYYNETLARRVEGANPANNADRRVLNDRWKTPGQHALYKNIKEYTSTYISTRFVQKEQFLQLSNLSLSYDFGKNMIEKLGMNSLRLSFYMNDVFRVSTIKNERGLDYPFQVSYVFGLNIGF